MKKSRTLYRNGENGVTGKHTRFDILDAHRERVAIKKRHPEHPNLTAYALHIIEQERKAKHE